MIRFEPRAAAPLTLVVAVRLLALAAAFALAAIPLAAAGAPVGRAFGLMLEGAGGSLFAATETLTRATPLILTGLAAAVAFRARLFNIGAEGQLYAGALAAVAIGSGAVQGPPLASRSRSCCWPPRPRGPRSCSSRPSSRCGSGSTRSSRRCSSTSSSCCSCR